MAESEGLGSLRSPSSLLRKLSYYRLLLTRLCLAKDCKGSNPFFTFKQKTGHSFCYALFFMSVGYEKDVFPFLQERVELSSDLHLQMIFSVMI